MEENSTCSTVGMLKAANRFLRYWVDRRKTELPEANTPFLLQLALDSRVSNTTRRSRVYSAARLCPGSTPNNAGGLTPCGIDRVSKFKFESIGADGSPPVRVLEMSAVPASVITLSWTVSRVVIAPAVALGGFQSLSMSHHFTLTDANRQRRMFSELLSRLRGHRLLERGNPVWLAKKLPRDTLGACRTKLAGGWLRYAAESDRLWREGPS